MQLSLTMTRFWSSTLLLFCLFSPAHAVEYRTELTDKSDPGVNILELLESDRPLIYMDGRQTYQVPSGKGTKTITLCDEGRDFTPYDKPYIEGGKRYVGCCPPQGTHLSGNTAIGFSCCADGTDRRGNAQTGYACCPPGKEAKGKVSTGQFKCCDADQDVSADAAGTLACCPKGKRVSGTVASGEFLCCPAGTSRMGDKQMGFHCCGEGERPTGAETTGYACCPLGQEIKGNAKTGPYVCCGSGHDGTPDGKGGLVCCPENSTYENGQCKPAKKVCENGKQLIDGKCACPPGTKEDNAGKCVGPQPQCAAGKVLVNGQCECPLGSVADASGKCVPKPCSSGIVSGTCYEIQNRDGRWWAYGADFGLYTAANPNEESAHFKIGKFQFCSTEECSKGTAVNPTDGFSMRDLYGIPPGGSKPRAWLSNEVGGGHLKKTWDYSEAGRFSITKWPCGKYCIAGAPDLGLGYTCPSTTVGITFAKTDQQSCIQVTLKEVPCDIRDVANNCIWKSPQDQCCGGPVDCSIPAPATVPAPAVDNPAQKPVKGKN